MPLTLLPTPRQLRCDGQWSDADPASVNASIDPARMPHAQGYRLSIGPQQIELVAHDHQGAFYGRMTLLQLARQTGQAGKLTCATIEDWPDFPVRGVMLDISRDKVPTMATLKALVATLAEWKVNQLQLYTEHTFAYRNHRVVWEHASPMAAEEIRDLDSFCQAHFIDLVPNQASFGHLHRWLKHEPYRQLAEMPEGAGSFGLAATDPFTICPLDPRSLELLNELYDELLPNFSSALFNVDCDETWDLGRGRSRADCDKRGAGRVYLDFLLSIHRLVQERGKTMQFWGDIILNHPELIKQLPKDAIALEWGYEADHPFAAHTSQFAAAGVPFYVCPGTSSWLSLAGRTANMLGNLASAAEHGLAHGAIGFLNTDWGDLGHWQPLPVSYPGLAYGAAVSWCLSANRDLNLPDALDHHCFQDPAGVLGSVAFDLGNAYQKTGVLIPNWTVFAYLLLMPDCTLGDQHLAGLTAPALQAAADYTRQVIARLPAARSARPDVALLTAEYRQAAALIDHACQLGRARLTAQGPIAAIPADQRAALAQDWQPIVTEHRCLWLSRNRPGGLADSITRMDRLLRGYHA